ncbi:YHS domain protein [Desulfonatronospira thiodismutans ASO3-1]|uniref:YHS domain protein n=1 Tax=Desulfonatronospira thiodismutans ASO3-1 TaxID=555779 RepID=D6SM18_9BACT|nr:MULTISPECIES: YHS domain-containing protein [Desulfonatronospira]EFI35729.1 YHS domain protein [Desulfonatronospira thiodismutans ASO3-1]RQD76355.1 MAG: YHS domain-containing protein [Desulfonatronospira sp. MSAO_Bac3]
MMKFIVIAVVLFILYKLLTNDQKKKKDAQLKEKEKLAASGIMVKDPVCGTYVDKDSDVRIKKDGQVYCFCSYDCRDKYLKKIKPDS